MRFRLACLGALVLVAGCKTASPPSAGTSPRPLALPDLLHLAASDAEALLRRLQEPTRAETEPVENRHVPGQIDTLRTLVYDGLRIQLYEVADGSGRRLVQEVTVTGEGYATAEGLGVGSTRAEVREALGEPLYAEADALGYEVQESPDDPTPALLHVEFQEERVAALRWSLYVD